MECGLGVRIHQRVSNHDAILACDKDFLAFQNHSSNAEGVSGHFFAVVFSYVFVAVGTIAVVVILVQSQVERSSVLDHGLVERREQYMAVVVEFRNGYDEQPVLFSGVAAHNSGAVICARLIGAKHFPRERLLEVNHQVLIKFQITHNAILKS